MGERVPVRVEAPARMRVMGEPSPILTQKRNRGQLDAARLPDAEMLLARAAVRYAELGCSVLQLVEEGKVPTGRHGLTDATTDVAMLAKLWRRRPRANIGLRIPPGLVVVDVDGPPGVEALRSAGAVPRTLTASTARGWHLWFVAPALLELRQRAGILPGVDVRVADKGYVVVPPSIHETGVVYTWARRIRPAPLPEWLVGLVHVHPTERQHYAPAATDRAGTLAQRYAYAAVEGEAAAVATTPAGSRNHRLFAAWARCTRDADVAPYIERQIVVTTLTRAALAAGLPADEIRRTLRELPARRPKSARGQSNGIFHDQR